MGAVLLVLVVATGARAGALAPRPAIAVGGDAPDVASLQGSAASALATALTKGGSGITFEIIQRSTIVARDGGPRIPVPDPVDPHKTIAKADQYFLNAITERGFATADGFYAELRAGPAPDEKPDWDAEVRLQALETGGTTFRNDGEGWYETDAPPGVGLDPVSVRLLPLFLRDAAGAKDAGVNPGDASLRDIAATGALQHAPGIIAADGASFTELLGPATFSLDPDGRLVGVHAAARNTNLEDFDLVVETDIVLRYGVDGPLPDPSPALGAAKPAVVP